MIENYMFWVAATEQALRQLPPAELNEFLIEIEAAHQSGRFHIYEQTYWA